MSKLIKLVIVVVAFFLIFGLFVTETYAGKKYYSGTKRRIKSYYYKIQKKPKATVKLNLPFHRQEHSLSCEAAALKMALQGKGVDVSESTIISQLNFEPMWGNPHRGFVGDINGKMFKTGCGVYWGPIAGVGNLYRPSEAFEHWSVQSLASEIQKGNPVIVWGYVGSGKRKFWQAPDGTPILGVSGEHTRVAIGFAGSAEKPTGFFLLDPIYGEIYWSTGQFNKNWGAFGNSGVVIR